MRCLLCAILLIGCGKVLDQPGTACTLDSECSDPALPFCIRDTCAASCSVSSDCVDPDHSVCASDSACVGCETAADCTGVMAPVCDTDSRACRACTADAECGGGVCIEAEGSCVA